MEEPLESLVHDLSSKCASLKTAINLLPAASPQDVGEILALMKRQANDIAGDIEAFEVSSKNK